MAAPKGNQFWLARARSGPEAMFKDPAVLWESCLEYFKWVEENPLYSDKVGFSEGVAVHTPVAHPRAMTIVGLCLFLGIAKQTYYNWKKDRPDIAGVLTQAEKVIWSQKFEAAAAGLLNANIISRELGLADKTDVNMTVPTMVINPPAGERPYPTPPIHGENDDSDDQ